MTQEFAISGMSCDHCRRHVERAIAAVPGVQRCQVDLKAASARVEGEAPAAAIAAAVQKAGYSATLAAR